MNEYTQTDTNEYVEVLSGEERLLAAIIESAVKETDKAYFESETFEEHCEMLGVNSDILRLHCLAKMER